MKGASRVRLFWLAGAVFVLAAAAAQAPGLPVQPRGNSAGRPAGPVQRAPTCAGIAGAIDASGLLSGAAGEVSLSGQQVLGDTFGVALSSLGLLPGPATVLVLQIVHGLLPGVPTASAVADLVHTGVLV